MAYCDNLSLVRFVLHFYYFVPLFSLSRAYFARFYRSLFAAIAEFAAGTFFADQRCSYVKIGVECNGRTVFVNGQRGDAALPGKPVCLG